MTNLSYNLSAVLLLLRDRLAQTEAGVTPEPGVLYYTIHITNMVSLIPIKTPFHLHIGIIVLWEKSGLCSNL